jgi:hypothetical protein
MLVYAIGSLTVALCVVATAPAIAQHTLDLSLGPQWAVNASPPPPQRSNTPYYSSTAAQNQPAPANKLDLSMDVQTEDGAPGKVSLGSVGPESQTGGSGEDDHSYFDIPSQRPLSSASGLLVKIPLENDQSP